MKGAMLLRSLSRSVPRQIAPCLVPVAEKSCATWTSSMNGTNQRSQGARGGSRRLRRSAVPLLRSHHCGARHRQYDSHISLDIGGKGDQHHKLASCGCSAKALPPGSICIMSIIGAVESLW